jgi:hypothetical protein
LQVFDLNGKNIKNEIIEVDNTNQTENINTSDWYIGMYQVFVKKDGFSRLIPIVKK